MNTLVTRPSYIRSRLASAGIRPSKALGQNFLADANILDIILHTADLKSEDKVLEIGPGLGGLTVGLLAQVDHLTCIEKDHKLAALLREDYSSRTHFTLIEADALDVDLHALIDSGITRVISNLPYSVGTRILMTLLQSARPPERMVVLLQRDVAEKFTAQPGSRSYGLTGVWGQLHYRAEIVHLVAPGCFVPPPRVESAILLLSRLENPPADKIRNRKTLDQLTRHAFEHRRKQLIRILRSLPGKAVSPEAASAVCAELGLNEKVRPEQLIPADWVRLSNRIDEEQPCPC